MLRISYTLFTCVFILGIVTTTLGQTVVAFQGGEGTLADNWGYVAISNAGGPIPPGAVTTYPRTGSYSIRAGGGNTVGCSGGANCISVGGATTCPMHGKTIQFNSVNVACLSDVQLSVYHRSHNFCSGDGFDVGESIFFEIRLNGGAWTTVATIGGSADYTWLYTTNPAGSTSSVPNPFVYNVPAGTSTFEFRTRATLNRSDEVYYLDDVKLTTSTTFYGFPGTPGLWHGAVSTDWNNTCNWHNRTLPIATTDVLIPNSSMNSCEILPFSSGNCRNIIINKSKLSVENFTSTLNVAGNLTLEIFGELDLSLNSTEGGTINLSGDWFNKRDETFVSEEGSTVNFIGIGTQAVSVMNDTKEAFYKLRLNKPAGSVWPTTDIWIDKNNGGGASAMMNLQNGSLDLNARELVIWNDNPAAVSRTGGGIISERPDNQSRVTWKTGSTLGLYTFPFQNVSGIYIPFEIDLLSGSSGQLTIATYGTPPDNLPWPVSPVAVMNLASSTGLSPDNRDATVDRFWQIDMTGSASANMNFNYAASELPASPYNNPSSLKAQRYDPGANFWQPYLPGQSASTFFVNAPSVNNFSTWTLTNDISPLPIELLNFEAWLQDNDDVKLTWTTASEINNDYFTLEKSTAGVSFESFHVVKGAGNSNNEIQYRFTDEQPFQGITYYRLKQTDFDGMFSYSDIVAIRIENETDPFTIFPNPASEYFYISIKPSTTDKNLFISEMNGKIIQKTSLDFSKENDLIKIDCTSFARGMYLIYSESGNKQKLLLK